MRARFGPAGNSPMFYDAGRTSSLEVPAFLAGLGLSAYEYQCGRGVRVKEEFCLAMKQAARDNDVALSLHAPYYINLASSDPAVMESSLEHIRKSLSAASSMGASRVVVHPGSVKGEERQQAVARVESLLERIAQGLLEDYPDVEICLETMGKINQVGNLEEIIRFCRIHTRYVPTIDFGHLHARSGGKVSTREDFRKILEAIGEGLGNKVLRRLHIHFSPIEFSQGGEVRHRTFGEDYGPPFEPLAQVMTEMKMTPVIICESNGTQTEDAITMKEIWNSIQGGRK
jgi:deoxyribonuclease IV